MINWQLLFLPLFTVPQYLFCANSIVCYSFKTHPNSIENFNRQLRKVTKSRAIFPTDDALFKMLYLAMIDATKKWTGKSRDWGLALDQLCIYFEERIQLEDI